VVDEHVDRLDLAKADDDNFSAAMAALKKDKRVKAPELSLIASNFRGLTDKFKKKSDAYDAIIRKRQTDRASAKDLRRIKDIF
jgi:hypothetical protein